jgi:hypothetical protein
MANFTFRKPDGTLTGLSAFDEAEAQEWGKKSGYEWVGAGGIADWQNRDRFNSPVPAATPFSGSYQNTQGGFDSVDFAGSPSLSSAAAGRMAAMSAPGTFSTPADWSHKVDAEHNRVSRGTPIREAGFGGSNYQSADEEQGSRVYGGTAFGPDQFAQQAAGMPSADREQGQRRPNSSWLDTFVTPEAQGIFGTAKDFALDLTGRGEVKEWLDAANPDGRQGDPFLAHELGGYVDPMTGQWISTGEGSGQMEGFSALGGNLNKWSDALDKKLGADPNRGVWSNTTGQTGESPFDDGSLGLGERNADWNTYAGRNAEIDPNTGSRYDVMGQGGTNGVPIGKPIKDNDSNSAMTLAYMDPDPQNGINVMLELLEGTKDKNGNPVPLDDASRETVLANIGNLYATMQASNPYGYTADSFAAEAALDRSSQEQIARGGLTSNYISNEDAKNRATETYAIDANRYATEQALEGQKYSADSAAAGVRGAAAFTGAATQYAGDAAATATVEVADLALEGLKYSTDENSQSAITIAATQKAAVVYTAQANQRISEISGLTHERVAEIQKQASIDVAQAGYYSAEAVAALNAGGAEQVAISQGWSAEQVAAIQRESANQVAAQTGLTELMVANIMEASKTSVAEIMADAQTDAATTSANPFDLSGQQFLDMQGTQARGGLTVDQRMAEISAANEPERLAALLGALDPGVQGSLQGFGMTAPPTVPTISNLRNTSAERQQYIEGLFGSFGVSPSMLANLVKSVTPGNPLGASSFA